MISDETLVILRWVVWLGGFLLACTGSWFVFQRERGMPGVAWAGFIIAVLFYLSTLADSVLSDEQDSRERKKISGAILEQIGGVRASGDVIVGEKSLGLSDYLSRLERSGCLSTGERQGDIIVLGERNCLPNPNSEREQEAFNLLGSVVLNLEVFGKPAGYVGCGYEGLEGSAPDFSVRVAATLPEGTLQLSYNRDRREFMLRTDILEKPKEKFNINDGKNGETLTAGNLEGARLLIRLQSFSAAGGEESAWLRTKLDNFQIQFTGSSPVVARPGWHQVGTNPPMYLVCLGRKNHP